MLKTLRERIVKHLEDQASCSCSNASETTQHPNRSSRSVVKNKPADSNPTKPCCDPSKTGCC